MTTEEEIYRKVAAKTITKEQALLELKALFKMREAARSGGSSAQVVSPVEAPKPATPKPTATTPTPPVQDGPIIHPLSEAQKAVWFIQQVDPSNYAYHLPQALMIKKKVDEALMEQAFRLVMAHFPVLRTTFRKEGDEPVAVVAPTVGEFFVREDLSQVAEEGIIPHIRDIAFKPFDLEKGPLFRIHSFRRSETEHYLLLVVHHIIFDGGSYGLLFMEFEKAYRSLTGGAVYQPPVGNGTYADFVEWQTNMLNGELGASHWAYWQKQLEGELPILTLPCDYPRQKASEYEGSTYEIELDQHLVTSLKRLARTERVSLFMIMLAAFKILMARYTSQSDIIVGTPLEGRPGSRFKTAMGFFINMVPLRSNLANNLPFSEFLQQVKKIVLGGLDHGNYPYPTLVSKLDLGHDSQTSPLFQVAFILQNWIRDMEQFRPEERGGESAFGSNAQALADIHETGAYDLTVEVLSSAESTKVWFKYHTGLFKPERIARSAEHFRTLLTSILGNPKQNIFNLNILPGEEKHKLLVEFNRKIADTPIPHQTIHSLFEAQASKTPEAMAVSYEGESLTYGELNARANQMARHLGNNGVKPGAPVGICLGRSLDLAVGLLGILKAGGCYVPLDPKYPKDRIAAIVEDASMNTILSVTANVSALGLPQAGVICMDQDQAAISAQSTAPPPVKVYPENLAYTIYTSGSTGKPKGVLISHGAIVNYATGFVDHYKLTPQDRVMQFASINFDTAGEEIYPTWISGGALIFRTEEVGLSIPEFLRFLEREAITVVDLPTAFWHTWVAEMEVLDSDLPEAVRIVIVGGEEAKTEQLAIWQKRVGNRALWSNTYGPTEATIAATLFEPEFSKP